MLAWPIASHAANCTTQAEMLAPDRDLLAAISGKLAVAAVGQDYPVLQAALLPAETSEWNGIRDAVDRGAPMVKGGQVQLRNLYVLDASSQTAVSDTQFFCSNASGSLTVTMNMRSLPPGKYAVVLADAAGSPMAGQLGMVLAWDPTGATRGWKLAGISLRCGALDGHDSLWYWARARELMKDRQPWSAWFTYEVARYLSVPVDFISSPNLEKLSQEQAQIKDSPQDAFPYSLQDGDRIWKIDAVRMDASLRQADLAVTYESTGVTDQAAVRTEATEVLSALLKAQPALRQNFHGMWAIAVKDGKQNPLLELPMAQIPQR
jgi:hypothetical protein